MLSDSRYTQVMEAIEKVIHEDTHYQKGAMNMRTQKCFAIKVCTALYFNSCIAVDEIFYTLNPS